MEQSRPEEREFSGHSGELTEQKNEKEQVKHSDKQPSKRGRKKRREDRLHPSGMEEHWESISLSHLEKGAEFTQQSADSKKTLYHYGGLVLQLHEFMVRKYGKSILNNQQRLVDKPSVNELINFLQFKRNTSPEIKSGYLAQFRSAIHKFVELFNDNNVTPYTSEEKVAIKRFLTGTRKELSAKIQAGEVSSRVGKDHLKVDEYISLCEASLTHQSKLGRHDAELHLFIVLCWCMLSREETTVSFHSKHLEWEDDSLIVNVSSTKRNYTETPDKYRLYPNPYLPQCCPITAITIACACDTTILGSERPLFHHTQVGGKSRKKDEDASAVSRLFKELCELVCLFSV